MKNVSKIKKVGITAFIHTAVGIQEFNMLVEKGTVAERQCQRM